MNTAGFLLAFETSAYTRLRGLLGALGLLSVSCTSLGPHPVTIAMPGEVKAQTKITRILVLPPLGTGSNDQETELNRIVPAAAYQRYGELIIVGAGLRAATKSLAMPDNVGVVLGAAWQLAFYDWVRAGVRGKDSMHLEVPNWDHRVPQTDRDLVKLGRTLRKQKTQVDELGAALDKADGEALHKAAEPDHKALVAVENLHRHLMRRLKVTYLVATVLEGDEAAFDARKPVTLHAALINARTGMFRYYAVSTGRKGDISADFKGLVGIMAKNLFEDMKALDGIER